MPNLKLNRSELLELHVNSSERLANLRLPGSEEAEKLEPERAGVGTYLIEILVLVHLIPVLYWISVLIRQSLNPEQEGIRRAPTPGTNIMGRWAEAWKMRRLRRMLRT